MIISCDLRKSAPGWITNGSLNYVYDSLMNIKGVDTVMGELEYSYHSEVDKRYAYFYNVALIGNAFDSMSEQECKTHAEQLIRKVYAGLKQEQLYVNIFSFKYYSVNGGCANIVFSPEDGNKCCDFNGQIGAIW
jgi:hypothetical protein